MPGAGDGNTHLASGSSLGHIDWRRRVGSLRRLRHADLDEHAKASTKNNFPSNGAVIFQAVFPSQGWASENFVANFSMSTRRQKFRFRAISRIATKVERNFWRARCRANINSLWSMLDPPRTEVLR
jgi:hypothetical protein